MIAIIDVAALSPQFMNAVTRIHQSLLPACQLMCFGGFGFLVAAALRERAGTEIWRGMTMIVIVVLLNGNTGDIGNWIESVVLGVEQDSGVGNQTAFADYLDQIKIKFGIDLGALNNALPVGPNGNPVAGGNQQLGGLLSGHEADFQAAGAANGIDPKFLEAIAIEETGNGTSHALQAFNNPAGLMNPATPNDTGFFQYATIQDGINAEAANLQKNYISQGLTTISAIGAKWAEVGVANDPNGTNAQWPADVSGIYQGLGGTDVAMGTPQATTAGGNPVTDTWNALIHPGEAVQSALLGVIIYFVSLIAVGAWWVMALLQSVLFYVEIAIAPLFLGALLIRGWENVAKVFIATFVAICLWPIAFLFTSLVTKLILSWALNTSNNAGVAAANAVGLSYFWIIVLAVWVLFGTVIGPLLFSKQIINGATGMAGALMGAGNAGVGAARMAAGGLGQQHSPGRAPRFSRYNADND